MTKKIRVIVSAEEQAEYNRRIKLALDEQVRVARTLGTRCSTDGIEWPRKMGILNLSKIEGSW